MPELCSCVAAQIYLGCTDPFIYPYTSCSRPVPWGRVPTRAPLLSKIMKTMKVSNQLCSTILKQALRSVHHIFPRPWEMST